MNIKCDSCKKIVEEIYVYGPSKAIKPKNLCRECYPFNWKKRKEYTLCRNKGIELKSNNGVSYISHVLVAKKLGLKTCFQITDNFTCKILKQDSNFIGVSGSRKSKIKKIKNKKTIEYGIMSFNVDLSRDKIFCIGYDEEMNNVFKVYVIDINVTTLHELGVPEEIIEIINLGINKRIYYRINIYDSIKKKSKSKYEQFRQNEDEENEWNNLYKSIINNLDKCNVLIQNRE